MTAPTPHGYPDFGRFIAGADKLLTVLNDNAMNAPQNYGPFFIGDLPYVRFRFRAFVNNFDVTVNFYEDEAFTTLLGTEAWSANTLDVFDQALPALGPFMQITVSPTAAGSSFNLRVAAAHSLWRPNNAGYRSALPFDGVAVNHPVGITNLEAPYVVPGPGVFHGECTVANCRMDLQAIDSLGVVHRLLRIRDLEGLVTRQFFAPAMHLRLSIDNASGGVAPFTYSVMTQYGGVH